jgi:regulator of protease activity HflC (stomatin/prohibitin superfamily)
MSILSRFKSFILFVLVLILPLFLTACTTVEPGEVGVKSTLGKLDRTPLNSGIHIMIPILDSWAIYSTRTVALPEEFATLTKDGQAVKVTGIAEYAINPAKAPSIYENLGSSASDVQNKVINPVLLSAVKIQVADKELSSVISDQNGLSSAIVADINLQLKENEYVKFDSFKVTGIVLDPQVQSSIERKQIAKQELERKSTEIQIAEGEVKRLNILKTGISDLTIKQDFVNKWDGKTPIGGNIIIDATKDR